MSIVVTGIGLCTSAGATVDETWDAVSLDAPVALHPSTHRGLAGAESLAERACAEALTSAGLWDGVRVQNVPPDRLACTVSASKPFFNDGQWIAPHALGEFLAGRFGLSGMTRTAIAACATGVYSIALAASWIEQGLCDVALAGSVEPSLHPLMAAGFRQMGVLSDEECMRPFSRDRSGFVIGEGAGVLVLESSAHAKARTQPARAALAGWGLGADAHSAVAFNSNGQKIADVIVRALRRARLSAAAILHVNAHGTATRLNDELETQALRRAFGGHADSLHISATKSSTGHLLGAAGGVEAALTVLALDHQFVPPTRHLVNPDPACGLNYMPGVGRPVPLAHALSLSFGFGGSIGALVFSGLS